MRTVLTTVLLVVGLLVTPLLVSPANAQTPSVPVNTPFQVEFTHDGVNTAGYRLYLDGKQWGTDYGMGSLTAGVVRVTTASGVAAGPHSLEASAFGPGGETKSPVLAFTGVIPPPSAPGTPKIVLSITQQADGTSILKIESIEWVNAQ